jgi:hypothetical protein
MKLGTYTDKLAATFLSTTIIFKYICFYRYFICRQKKYNASIPFASILIYICYITLASFASFSLTHHNASNTIFQQISFQWPKMRRRQRMVIQIVCWRVIFSLSVEGHSFGAKWSKKYTTMMMKFGSYTDKIAISFVIFYFRMSMLPN